MLALYSLHEIHKESHNSTKSLDSNKLVNREKKKFIKNANSRQETNRYENVMVYRYEQVQNMPYFKVH